MARLHPDPPILASKSKDILSAEPLRSLEKKGKGTKTKENCKRNNARRSEKKKQGLEGQGSDFKCNHMVNRKRWKLWWWKFLVWGNVCLCMTSKALTIKYANSPLVIVMEVPKKEFFLTISLLPPALPETCFQRNIDLYCRFGACERLSRK